VLDGYKEETMDKGLLRIIGWALTIVPFLLCPAMTCHQERILTLLGKAPTPVASTAPTPRTTPVATAADSHFEAKVDSTGKITLTGIVSDDATKTKLGEKAVAVFGKENVTNNVEVKAGATATWVDAALAMLPEIKTPVKEGGILASNEKFHIQGEMPDANAKDRLAERAKAAAGSLPFGDELTIVLGAPTTTPNPDATPAPEATPTPAPEVKAVQAEINQELLLRTVEFETNSARLTPAGKQTLDFVASELGKVKTARVEIGGHTDDKGDAALNQRLSEQRAQATLRYLTGKGVGADRMNAIGYGENQPKTTNATEQGRAQNRRIEFKLR
jgi:OOP family OmpA-OmpF porin